MRYYAAVLDDRHATEIDSSFTLAYLALSMAADWEGQANTASWAIGMAMKHHADLKPLDQWRVRAWDAWIGGRPGEAERLLRLIVAHMTNSKKNPRFHTAKPKSRCAPR